MNLFSTLSLGSLLTGALSPFAFAGDVTAENLLPTLDQNQLVANLNRVLFDAPAPGVLHARGATWKASFDADGARYIPFLGTEAPRNFPLNFRLEAASVGGKQLSLDDQPSVRREGNRVILDHGPILEVYDLDTDSIEQSFVLPRRSRGGEVRVRLAVDSELEGRQDGRGLRFDGAFGGVHYGEAFAFDPAGRRADVASRLEGRSLELTVPDAFPVEDGGELVIDPVITTQAVSQGGLQRAQNSDVAFEKDTDGGVYLVVYEIAHSGSDTDIFSAEVVKATGEVRNVEPLDLSSDDWKHPRVACNDFTNAYVTVCEVTPAGSGLSDIVSRLRVPGSTTVSLPNTVNNTAGNAICKTPDIGGESAGIPGGFVAVWQEDIGSGVVIRAQAISNSGAILGFPIFLSPAGVEDSQPAISQSPGDSGPIFNVAWTRTKLGGDRDIYAAQVELTASGVTTETPRFLVSAEGDQHSPSVSAMGPDAVPSTGERPWVIACEQGVSNARDVIVHALSGDQVYDSRSIKTMEDTVFAGFYATPSIGCFGQGFALTYSSDEAGIRQVYMNTLYTPETSNGMALALAERRQKATNSNGGDFLDPRMVTEWEAGLFSSDEGMISYTLKSTLGPSQVYAARFESFNSPAIGTQYCEANYSSAQENGWLAMYGDPSAGATHVALASDLPPQTICMMIVGPTTANINMPGATSGRLCVGNTGRLLYTVTGSLSNGTAFFLPDSGNLASNAGPAAAQPGETWYYQVWFRDVVGGQGTSNFTNAVSVQYH